jgi:hypothetical protein
MNCPCAISFAIGFCFYKFYLRAIVLNDKTQSEGKSLGKSLGESLGESAKD